MSSNALRTFQIIVPWPTIITPQSACIVMCILECGLHLLSAICFAMLWVLPKLVAWKISRGNA